MTCRSNMLIDASRPSWYNSMVVLSLMTAPFITADITTDITIYLSANIAAEYQFDGLSIHFRKFNPSPSDF